MRTGHAVFAAVAMTFVGLLGVVMLAASGVSWGGSGLTVVEYSDSDDSERLIGITIGVLAVALWLLVSVLMAWDGGTAGRENRLTARVAFAVGAALVVASFVVLMPVNR